MSSDANPQQYPGPPSGPAYGSPGPQQPPPGAYQPQQSPPGAYQPQQSPQGAYQPVPYVEPGAPQAGQPPYLPPGAYVPVPPPQPRGGRGAKVAVAAILSVVLIAAVGAVVLFKFVLKGGPDPAESFPASAGMYLEVNLDPSLDQTPKLLEHLSKFEDLDYDSTDDLLTDLLEETGLEGVDAEEDLTSWIGNRHGLAMWTYQDQPYAVVSLASTDAGAAEDGLASIRAAAGATEDQMAYTVEDDHVLMVVGEQDAAAALEAARSEAGADPLSASADYDEARSWLDGDQLAVYWVDMDAVAELAEMTGEDADMFSEFYSGQLIAGFSAFDQGFELSYRLFGDRDDPWTGSGDLLAGMGELPAADFAATVHVPEDIGELTEEWLGAYGLLYGEATAEPAEPALDPLTAEEYAEYLELETGYYAGTLTPEEESRYFELENRYWTAGTEEDPWVDDYDTGPTAEEIQAQVTEITDLLAGADLSVAGDFSADEGVNPESMLLSAHLAEDRAADLQALVEELVAEEGGALPEGVTADGAEISYTGGETASGTLAEDARFSDFAAAAPDQAAVAVWVDLAAAVETYPEDFDGGEPLSAFAWAHGSDGGDGTGVLRLYLTD
ncbi:hypothetical protein [Glycomyces terrestris]|uniref:DUF3352 domain-containing protein n=1 Tax=Glycomyces terrestris TaxID=2493553 RepID=A0A426UUA0_9ACTN|nr:hypothetical protein [Glycomyces terrestris]RRR97574.1 hypothetical protein EIW28_19495 [Glycomyces terrestris]